MLSLRRYGVRFPEEIVVKTLRECEKAADHFSTRPVALKVKSDDIVHKTDVGGVILGAQGREAIVQGYKTIVRNIQKNAPSARLDGVTVQEMVPPGVEAIIGLVRDPVFGPCIMFGLGGVFTELFRDVTFRALPITRGDAVDMIESLRNARVLKGFRGGRVNLDMVVDLLMLVGSFGWDHRDQLGSVDLNPVILWENDYRVVDEKVLLEQPLPLASPQTSTSHIRTFFEARSVAVVGATETEGKIGKFVMDSLSRHDYLGTVYPVNPRRSEVFGLKCYPSIVDIDGEVDLAVVTVPLETAPSVMRQCAAKGCHNMVIVSGGGKEIGEDRAQIEREIRELGREMGIRIIGCNCIGVFDGQSRLDTFFQTHDRMTRPRAGNVSMITQSGTVGLIFLEGMADLGVARFASIGNRIDVDEADLISFFAEDHNTRAVALYCEGLERGRNLMEAAKACSKPVTMYKAARTKAGSSAAVSHTGFYGGSYEVAQGVFRQAGMVIVDSIEELIACSKALGYLPVAGGSRVALISNGAGTTVQALDLIDQYGLTPAVLHDETVDFLRKRYPEFYQVGTLVDITGSATVGDYKTGIEALILDPNVDIIMCWFVLQNSPLSDTIAADLIPIVQASPKPVVFGAGGGTYTQRVRQAMERGGVPMFGSVREWVAAAGCLVRP